MTTTSLALALSLSVAAVAAAERPNVLLLISDDHAAAHVGCYGNADVKTPHLDRLASEGMRFERFYVGAPQCVPSRATFMTGRSPVSTTMTRFSAPLPREIVTFPELLRKAGYRTGICGRSFHLDGGRTPPETARVFEEHDLQTFDDRVDFLNSDANREHAPQLLQEFLGSVPQDSPFFLQLGFSDPHRPYTAGPGNTPAKNLTLPPHYPDTPAVREDFAANNACAVTKLIFDKKADLEKVHPAVKDIVRDKATATDPVPLHPGAKQALG